jgi:hypothetical protein
LTLAGFTLAKIGSFHPEGHVPPELGGAVAVELDIDTLD